MSVPKLAAGAVGVVPGELFADDGDVEINPGRPTANVEVINTGDRPVQVGSHFHFFEVNAALRFDRTAAFGFRLNISSGTAVRFEPGERRKVELVALGGARRVFGLNGLTDGSIDDGEVRERSLRRAGERGFL